MAPVLVLQGIFPSLHLILIVLGNGIRGTHRSGMVTGRGLATVFIRISRHAGIV